MQEHSILEDLRGVRSELFYVCVMSRNPCLLYVEYNSHQLQVLPPYFYATAMSRNRRLSTLLLLIFQYSRHQNQCFHRIEFFLNDKEIQSLYIVQW